MVVAISFETAALLGVVAIAYGNERRRNVRGQHHGGGWRRRVGAHVDQQLGTRRTTEHICAIPMRSHVACREEENAQ